MNRLKAHWKALASALLLVLGCLWYSRPVDVYGLAPGIEEPDWISIYARELGGGHDHHIRDFSPEDPEWSAVREGLETLRFHRPPWNLALQFLDEHTITGRATRRGDYHIMFQAGQQYAGDVQVQFFVDEWMYSSPYSNRNLTLWVKDSRETGSALAQALLPLMTEE